MNNKLLETTIGEVLEKIIDIGSNGSDESVSAHLNMMDDENYAYMLRTINFNNNNFKSNLKYIDKESYEWFSKSKVYGGEIVINKIGSPGSVGLVPKMDKPISLGLNQFAVVFKKDVDQLFMYYYLKNMEKSLKKLAHGSVTKTLTKDDVKSIKIFLPELKKQKKVGKMLYNLDEQISNNIDIIYKMDELIQSVYEYYFYQFDHVKDVNISDDNVLKRKIPTNWEIIPLNKICDIISGYPFSTDEYDENGNYKLITIKNVQDEGINLDTYNNISKLPNNLPDYCKLKPLDILMSLTGNVGRVGVMFDTNCLLNQRVAIIKPKNEIQKPFLYALFKNRYIRNKLINISSGTSQLNLSPINVGKILIPYDEKTINYFSSSVKSIFESISNLYYENEKLFELRNFLTPLLINGQSRIED